MRTTVNIDDHLLAEAKVEAVRTHRSLGDVIDDALRAMLRRQQQVGETARRVVLPTDGGSGLRPGVDLEDKEALADLLGDNESFRAAR
jgi:plasmid stability protein